MLRFYLVVFLFGITTLAKAQIYVDASSAYTFGGGISEIRSGIFINSKIAISIAGNFYTDGVSFETFPRLGILNLLRNKEGNYNIATYGLQLSGIGAQRDFSLDYNMDFLGFSPFINLRTPIFHLKGNCNCGKPAGLIFELVGDLNLTYPYLGIGIRKGFD